MVAGEPTEGGSPSAGTATPGSVLLVTPLWGRDGGVAAHVKESARALARAGVDVHVIAARRRSGEETISGVKIHHRPELLDTRAPLELRLGEALALAPEVAHIHQVDDPAIVAALRVSAPVVISAHGFPGCTSGVYYFAPGRECTRGHGPGCIPNLLAKGCAHTRYPRTLPSKYRQVTRGLGVLRQADLVVSYSSAVDRHLAANRLVRRAVIPYFPTMTPQQGSGHATRRRVVFAGRLVHSKGIDVLIEASAEVDAEFVICGDGRRLQTLRTLTRRLGVESRVRFKGWMDAEQLAEEFADASVAVVPSLWPEPFGIVGIEALAAGRPAVGSATGGIVDWLKDGVCGTTVPPGDAGALARALRELLDDPELQRAMGLAGRELVAERFSPARHLAALLEAYGTARSGWRSGRGETRRAA
jgi:glycosyltransferase involved in cell wall biosynthesis